MQLTVIITCSIFCASHCACDPWQLVVHNVVNEVYLPVTFPKLEALSCDASDAALSHIALMVR